MFFVAFASRLPLVRKASTIFSTKMILNPINILSICCLPLLSFVMGACMLLADGRIQQVDIPVGAPFTLAAATLLLSGLYYRNRSNKHGNLITQADQKGMIVVDALAFAFTAQYSQVNKDVASVFLPILVGSAIATLLVLTFASVADAWDAVGSGMFQMISLDTAALLGYVVTPILILASIASNKYGETVCQTVEGVLRNFISDEFIRQQERPPEQTMTSGLFLLLALATVVGVSVVNMLSPVGAYLFAKAYTNGQPRTRRLALCVHLKDLLGASEVTTEETMNELVRRLIVAEQKKKVFNIFVTAEELRLFPDLIRRLQSAGHAIGICSTTIKGITKAYETYIDVLEDRPTWYHVGTGSASRGPAALKTVTDLNLKVAFWSTHIGVTSRETLLKVDLPNLRDDVATTNGGSFVFFTDEWKDSQSVLEAIETIVQELSSISPEYSFSALSDVAREDSAMIL